MAIFVLNQLSQPGSMQSSDTDEQITNPRRTAALSYNIASLNLFGDVAEQAVNQPVDAPETKLNLELQGVFTSELPEHASAIVAQTGKDGILYFPGDRLPGNAILSSIFDDHILLKRGNGFESLKFSDDAFRSGPADESYDSASDDPLSGSTDQLSRRAMRKRAEMQRRAAQDEEDDPEPEPPPVMESPSTSLSDFVTKNRKRIDEDPASLLNELGLSSVTTGESEGYQLSGEIPEAILRRSGLQRGDTVLSVNGQPVGDVMQDAALIDAAMAEGQVRVEVQRDDRRFFVTVPVH
jgi:general secretion pathway protein C